MLFCLTSAPKLEYISLTMMEDKEKHKSFTATQKLELS